MPWTATQVLPPLMFIQHLCACWPSTLQQGERE
jgi:hypothetical protein